jgi:hypothetical protein
MAPFMMLVSRTSTAPDVTHAGHSVASPAPAAAVEAALRGFAGPRWPSAARSIIFEALVKVKLPPVVWYLPARVVSKYVPGPHPEVGR